MKMVLSDALSQWPEFCPENDNNNEDMVVLPKNLFVNLIDVNLQHWIADASELDADATEVLRALLGGGPTTFQNNLAEWTTENFNGKKVLFYRGKNYIPKDLHQEKGDFTLGCPGMPWVPWPRIGCMSESEFL